MSIGCYDFFQQKWIVGPELKDKDYNPWKDLYFEAREQAKHLIKDIRNIILDVYEKATAVSNAEKSGN